MNEKQFRAFLLREIEKAGSQKNWAEKHRISPQYVHDLINGRRLPGKKILDALMLQRLVCYVSR